MDNKQNDDNGTWFSPQDLLGDNNRNDIDGIGFNSEPIAMSNDFVSSEDIIKNNLDVSNQNTDTVNTNSNGNANGNTGANIKHNVRKKRLKNKKSKKNNVILFTLIGICAVVLFSVARILGRSNTYVCRYSFKDAEGTTDIAIKVTYASNGYESRMDFERVTNYNSLTDDKVLELLKELDPYGGNATSPNYKNFNVRGRTNLGYVSGLGNDTVVERNGNRITITYNFINLNAYKKLNSGYKATIRKTITDQGFRCR